MNHYKDMFRWIVLLLVSIFIIVLLGASFFLYQFNEPKSNLSKNFQFEIKPGEGFRQISAKLEEEGLINSAKYFNFYVLLKGTASKLKAGIYQLSPNMSPKNIADILYRGPVLKEVSVTIPEGYNIYQIDDLLAKKGIINKNDLINFRPTGSLINKYTFLAQKPREETLEGFLFPDTYRFFIAVNKDINSVVNKFLKNFNKHLNAYIKEEIEKKGESIYNVLILASLIEKEVYYKDDKLIVADILKKRLKKRMFLQVDASVLYAKMLEKNISWKKAFPLEKEDYKINSLYNTYKYKGLPPSPICNPGIDSILAVVFPEKTNYWYYISDPKTEKTIFSKTFKEHRKNILKYLVPEKK